MQIRLGIVKIKFLSRPKRSVFLERLPFNDAPTLTYHKRCLRHETEQIELPGNQTAELLCHVIDRIGLSNDLDHQIRYVTRFIWIGIAKRHLKGRRSAAPKTGALPVGKTKLAFHIIVGSKLRHGISLPRAAPSANFSRRPPSRPRASLAAMRRALDRGRRVAARPHPRVPCGATGTLKMQPTTTPFSSTS